MASRHLCCECEESFARCDETYQDTREWRCQVYAQVNDTIELDYPQTEASSLLDAIKARQNIKFVTFYQKKFSYSSKEAYYYGEKSFVLADIFTSAHLEHF